MQAALARQNHRVTSDLFPTVLQEDEATPFWHSEFKILEKKFLARMWKKTKQENGNEGGFTGHLIPQLAVSVWKERATMLAHSMCSLNVRYWLLFWLRGMIEPHSFLSPQWMPSAPNLCFADLRNSFLIPISRGFPWKKNKRAKKEISYFHLTACQ